LTNTTLAKSYLMKAQVRLKILDLLFENQAYSDVVGEAQEVVELALKGMLRQVGIEPPKYHDVGPFLIDHRQRFSTEVEVVRREACGDFRLVEKGERVFVLRGHRLHSDRAL
jgi:HEPN domain-containing protein